MYEDFSSKVVLVEKISWRACWLIGLEESNLKMYSEASDVCQVQSPRKAEALITGRVNRIWPVYGRSARA